jgi:hypothetical protein
MIQLIARTPAASRHFLQGRTSYLVQQRMCMLNLCVCNHAWVSTCTAGHTAASGVADAVMHLGAAKSLLCGAHLHQPNGFHQPSGGSYTGMLHCSQCTPLVTVPRQAWQVIPAIYSMHTMKLQASPAETCSGQLIRIHRMSHTQKQLHHKCLHGCTMYVIQFMVAVEHVAQPLAAAELRA